jgi:aryl-alcohol dehydrogenase-like predicted oxidoreductase
MNTIKSTLEEQKLKVTLGKTGITVSKDGLGALPLQRAAQADAIRLIQAAADGGIDYIDTARAYSDSEEKLGLALKGRREKVVIATKTSASTAGELTRQLEASLALLKTDYVDIYQLHNPDSVPKEDSEIYKALLSAKQSGKILHIGITNHRLHLAKEAVTSGLYETLQYPLSYLSSAEEQDLPRLCRDNGVGFIAMKAFAGGLITDAGLARRFQNQFDNSVPIWGLQHLWELERLLEARDRDGGAPLSEADEMKIADELRQLGGDFCRGCGYCAPCPEGIQIFNCARTSLLIRRAPSKNWFSDAWRDEMLKIKNCRSCGLCSSRCPYGLNTPALLRRNLSDYLEQSERFTPTHPQ